MENLFRQTFDNMLVGIQTHDFNWRYTYVNNTLIKYSSYSKEELLGHSVMEKYPGIEQTDLFKIMDRCMHERIPDHVESEFVFPDGTKADFELSIQPIPEGIFILSIDITERKKTEKQLAGRIKELSDYKEALDESAIVAITDEKGIIKHVNKNFCEISKYRSDELIGQDHRIINSGYHTKEFIKNLWATIANGSTWKGELKNRAKDGTIYWVDTTIVPFLNEENKPYQYLAIRSDITERKKSEEELVLHASIVDSSDDAILSKTLDGVITSWNRGAEKIFGYIPEEVIGKHISILMPPHLHSEEDEIRGKLSKGEYIDHFETTRIKKDGTSIYVSLSVSPIKDSLGNVVGASKILRDITSQKDAIEKINKANRLYTFISSINKSIVHIRDERILLRNACNIAVEVGQFTIAWIGMFDFESRKISLIEQCGIMMEDMPLFVNASYETKGPQDHILRTGTNFISNDIQNDLELPTWKAFAANRGINSCIVLPIKKFGKIIGSYNLYSTELHFTGADEIKLLDEVVGDISFAIENFERESRHRAAEIQIIQNERRFRETLDNMMEGIQIHDFNWRYTYVNNTLVKYSKYAREELIGFTIMEKYPGLEQSKLFKVMDQCMRERVIKHFETEFVFPDGTKTDFELSIQPVPEGIFILSVDISERKKAEQEIVAKNELLSTLTSHLQNAREEERIHIAREIHDELGQLLTALKMDIDWVIYKQLDGEAIVPKLREMLDLSDEVINTVRRISSELRPGILDDLGLLPTLEWKCDDYQEKTGIPCHFISTIEERKFDNQFSITVFRILQEALTNVSRHAEAKTVKVSVSENETEFCMEIVDDGKGIPLEKINATNRLGVLGMRERAELMHGHLTVVGIANKGTTIKLTLPRNENTNR